MLKEIISLLPENSSIKIYRDGEPILHYGTVMHTKEFAELFTDVEVKELRAIYTDDCGIIYIIYIV